ncbi:Acyl-protein thioesterase 1 [Gracilariopsis chorda]|uniref:Acyl-protein thioesterase 1 n=1 Tax=Gracilariopsis chorda TaxID=448386 RepID=A0A2V3J0R3_9FLOR|nr:Acyl-protein thioesterase 1 [Gracilariopsis chorda]|eukprot:PXF47968.1 Acyl-protein thioesterase 1 [Gracilariopsis chorda]
MKLASLLVLSLFTTPLAATFSISSILNTYFPCTALSLIQSSWETTYFEPTILPPPQQKASATIAARRAEAAFVNFTCDTAVSSSHVFRCNPNGFSFELIKKKPKATILFLHGFIRPSQAAFYIPALTALLSSSSKLYESIRIEVPLAPLRQTTLNPPRQPIIPTSLAWLNILPEGDDRFSLYRASQRVERLVLSQGCRFGHSPRKVLLAGHSLGGFTSLEFALSTDTLLGGVIAISSLLPRIQDYTLPPESRPFNTRLRGYNITLIHGTLDETVPVISGQATAQILKPISTVLGFGLEFVPLEGLDHSNTLIRSPLFYANINRAVAQAFSDL